MEQHVVFIEGFISELGLQRRKPGIRAVTSSKLPEMMNTVAQCDLLFNPLEQLEAQLLGRTSTSQVGFHHLHHLRLLCRHRHLRQDQDQIRQLQTCLLHFSFSRFRIFTGFSVCLSASIGSPRSCSRVSQLELPPRFRIIRPFQQTSLRKSRI